jgi:uncharacterized tellurite resistance protein B-like protein
MINRLLDLLRTSEKSVVEIDPPLAAAVLMFEVIWADHQVNEAEVQVMTELLAKQFSLDPSRVTEVVHQSKLNHDESVGVFPFTRVLNEHLSEDQKYEVIKSMWIIALADQDIDVFEEHTIRRIADLLYVPHARFIEAKHAVRSAD